MRKPKPTAQQRYAEATSQRFLDDMREFNRLAEQTENPRVTERLEQGARFSGQLARRWQDYATTLEYAHLYEEAK